MGLVVASDGAITTGKIGGFYLRRDALRAPEWQNTRARRPPHDLRPIRERAPLCHANVDHRPILEEHETRVAHGSPW